MSSYPRPIETADGLRIGDFVRHQWRAPGEIGRIRYMEDEDGMASATVVWQSDGEVWIDSTDRWIKVENAENRGSDTTDHIDPKNHR